MLIDVRTPDEYLDIHHEGAVNVPLDDIESYQFDIPADGKIILYCRSGARARISRSILSSRGIKNVELLNNNGEFWGKLGK